MKNSKTKKWKGEVSKINFFREIETRPYHTEEEFGYWDAFRSSVIEECVEVVEKKRVTMNIFGESDEKNDGIVMGLEIAKEELTRLNSLKEKTQ